MEKKKPLQSPKRGAIPTPPDVLERAPRYVPPDAESGKPESDGESQPTTDSTTDKRRSSDGKEEHKEEQK